MLLDAINRIFYWHFKGLHKKQTKWAGGRWNDGISGESWCARSDVPGSSGAQLFVGSGLTWLSWLLPRLSGLMMIDSHENQCRYLLVEQDAKVASFVWNSARRIACSADFAARLSLFDGDSKSPGTICWKHQRKVGSFILTKNQPHQLTKKTQNIVKTLPWELFHSCADFCCWLSWCLLGQQVRHGQGLAEKGKYLKNLLGLHLPVPTCKMLLLIYVINTFFQTHSSWLGCFLTFKVMVEIPQHWTKIALMSSSANRSSNSEPYWSCSMSRGARPAKGLFPFSQLPQMEYFRRRCQWPLLMWSVPMTRHYARDSKCKVILPSSCLTRRACV